MLSVDHAYRAVQGASPVDPDRLRGAEGDNAMLREYADRAAIRILGHIPFPAIAATPLHCARFKRKSNANGTPGNLVRSPKIERTRDSALPRLNVFGERSDCRPSPPPAIAPGFTVDCRRHLHCHKSFALMRGRTARDSSTRTRPDPRKPLEGFRRSEPISCDRQRFACSNLRSKAFPRSTALSSAAWAVLSPVHTASSSSSMMPRI